jgi:TolA-binding protein
VEKYPNHKTIEYALFGLIQSLTESKRLDEASAITEQFRKQFPKSVMLDSAGYMQAISVFSTGDFKDALQRFEKFLPTCKTPDMTESTEFYIAACHYGLENFSKANELFAAFTKKYPNSQLIPDVLFRLGRTNFELSQRAKKPEEIKKLINAAVGFYEQVRSRFPKYEGLAEIVFQLGYLYNYYGTHNEPAAYDKAVGAFTSFLDNWGNKTAPDGRLLAPEAWYQIARAHLAAKRYAKAIEAYQTLVQKFPDNDLAPYAAVEAGSAYYDLKKPADGLKALRAYVQKYPDHVKVGDVLFAIGSQIEADQPDEAIQTFQDLINRTAKADEKNREAWLNPAIEAQRHIVTLREKAGNIKAAVADSEAFLASFSNEPVAVREIFARMTALYRKAKLSAEGYAMFEKLAKQYSQITSFRIAAATSLIELALGDRDYARATAAALKLLQDPEKDRLPAITYLALGNAFLKTEKFDFARDAFQKTLKLYPNDTNAAPLAQLGLGQALLALKDFNGAETAFNKQMPANLAQAAPEALLGLARIYEERGRDKNPKEPINVKAVQYYNIAAQSGRRDIANEAYYRLGNFFFHIKESDPAKNQENKKTALPYFMRLFFAGEPFAEEGAFRAGQCHETLGNHEAALLAYQTYARRYPKGKFKAEADQKIADLTVKTKPAS